MMSFHDITKESLYDIRYFDDKDSAILNELLLNPQIQKWFPLSSTMDVELFVRNWTNFSKYRAAITAVWDQKPIGFGCIFLLPYRKVAIHTMAYLVVDPEFQKKGVGTSILRNLIHLSREFKIIEKVQCEIYSGCPLESILKKLSFKKAFTQEGFVRYSEWETSARMVFERSNQIEV
jgi:GNAT superfamily N-acetyltransferase